MSTKSPADSVHDLTSQVDRLRLSGRAGYSGPLRSEIPTSLLPANGAQVHPPSPSPSSLGQRRMEMPVPSIAVHKAGQSLTMSYARSTPPHDLPYVTSMPHFPQPLPIPQPDIRTHSFNSSIPPAPKIDTPTRPRASSTPASPTSPSLQPAPSSSPSSTVQCAGVTKAGKRCTRQVKAPPLVSYFTSSDDEPIERLCFQHVKEVLQPTGFYSRKPGAGWVEFSDWIPDYLSSDTQAALRVEMERPHSDKDEDGYIYTYEIRDDRTPDQIHLKVGRSIKLVRRLDQWSKQCTSKEVVLRGWWPGTVENSDTSNTSNNDASLLKGKINAGQKGPYCHRLERLIHLELADLSVHAPYLQPGYPRLRQDTPDHRSPRPNVKTPRPNKPCLDCGSVHKEIFSFKRIRKGALKDGEWEKIVQPVISKWGRFASEYL